MEIRHSSPESPIATSLRQARALMEEGRAEEAYAIFVRLLNERPGNNILVHGKARAAAALGKHAEAADDYAILLEKFPNEPVLRGEAAAVERALGNAEAAARLAEAPPVLDFEAARLALASQLRSRLEAAQAAGQTGKRTLFTGRIRSGILYAVLSWRGNKGLGLLKSASALIFSAVANYRAVEESQAKKELFLGVIRLIMGAVDAKDPTTAGHSERVAVIARELAGQLGMSPEEIEEAYLSGLLHDVGKIGIPDSILSKPGRLDEEEMEIMRRHPNLGAELMRQIKLPEGVIAGILEHHERPDGAGYPNRVSGESLSRIGAIIKVADVFDALASKRQYKDAMPMDKVREIIANGRGPEFNPEIASLFLEGDYARPNP